MSHETVSKRRAVVRLADGESLDAFLDDLDYKKRTLRLRQEGAKAGDARAIPFEEFVALTVPLDFDTGATGAPEKRTGTLLDGTEVSGIVRAVDGVGWWLDVLPEGPWHGRHFIPSRAVNWKSADNLDDSGAPWLLPEQRTDGAADSRLGSILVAGGILSKDDLEKGIALYRKTRGRRLGEVLVENRLIAPEQLASALAIQFGLQRIDLDEFPIDGEAVRMLPEALCRTNNFIGVRFNDEQVWLATPQPLSFQVLDQVRASTRRVVREMIATPEAVRRSLDMHFGTGSELAQLADRISVERVRDDDIEQHITVSDIESDASVSGFVNQVISRAVQRGASDIHITPDRHTVYLFYRIDGVMVEQANLPKKMLPSIVARIKFLSDMDLAEHRIPLDGRCRMRVGDVVCDMRISTLPTVMGESVCIRILTRDYSKLDLEYLGFQAQDLERFRAVIQRPFGMFLLTGPTGSGKTTTLYSILSEVRREELTQNIVSVEDPVEYEMSGVNQIQVRPKAGLTFGSALRNILRHDPDVILVGEIRDSETAKLAVQAALTGHRVFSSLHTNDAAGSLTRLADMGVEPYLVCSVVTAAVAQRLVRRICPNCRIPSPPSAELAAVARHWLPTGEIFKGRGCKRCNDSGYLGRTAIYEMMVLTDPIREAMLNNMPVDALRDLAVKEGMVSLERNALHKVADGTTTLEEVLRVGFLPREYES